jgi:diguanylate cyclase (GGDEF)-like protein/PAS domain S-box-containing protein
MSLPVGTDFIAKILDPTRLSALAATGLLDTEPEEEFERWTRLSSRLLGVPVALVSLVDADRQFFKSAVGLAEPWATTRQTPLSHSFCKHVVSSGAPLVTSDARLDPALKNSPAIAELDVIAYAGVPLIAAGQTVGAFCAIAHEPRDFSADDVLLLRELARAVETQIALRIANDTLHEREQMLDRVLDLMPTGVLLCDLVGRVMRTNTALGKLLGRSQLELAATDFAAITHPDDLAEDRALHERLLAGALDMTTRTTRYCHADGRYIWVRVASSVLRDPEGPLQGTIAVVEDVTAERLAEDALTRQIATVRRTQALFEATIGNIRDGVVLLDENWKILLANRAYLDLFGIDEADMPKMTRARFLAHVSALVEDPEDFVRRLDHPSPASDEFVLQRPVRRVVRRTLSSVELPDGVGNLVIWQDITVERELTEEREREAMTDALTGIANRRAVEEALRKEWARAERAGTPLSLAMFDIDHFKRVNDEHGHLAGDEVLKRVAASLSSAARLTDTVARWGGEEFLAVLPVGLDGALAFCERVRGAIEGLSCPNVGRVTISAGVVQVGPAESLENALERVDQRLYAAKASGRNRVQAATVPP